MVNPFDFIIVGSGMGGASVAHGLVNHGYRVLMVERGSPITESSACHSARDIFINRKFMPEETWLDNTGKEFQPGTYYNLGGNTKFYGAALFRFRPEEFDAIHYPDGVSPAWPISYDDLAPYYQQAETLFQVAGDHSQDPTEPYRIESYPFKPVSHEPAIDQLVGRLRALGFGPGPIPLGVNKDAWLKQGQHPWDAYPNPSNQDKSQPGKLDAESALIDHLRDKPNFTLVTDCQVKKLVANDEGAITEIQCLLGKAQQPTVYKAKHFILSAGAVNSAALLLASANDRYQNGLANSSGLVGCNLMNHVCSALMSVHPLKKNSSVYQKTVTVNAFNKITNDRPYPLGNIQLLGKVSGQILKAQMPWVPVGILNQLAQRSVDWYIMSEDLPDAENRVRLTKEGKIQVDFTSNNLSTHKALMASAKSMLRSVGYPILLSKAFDKSTLSHQCGTAKFGVNPAESVLNTDCRSWDHKNLSIVDASFFPSSGTLNPALTIAAQGLRVADRLHLSRAVATSKETFAY